MARVRVATAGRWLAAVSVALLLGLPAMAATSAQSGGAATTRTQTAKTTPEKPGAGQTAGAPSTQTGVVDINHASKAQLDSLPGIGKRRAEAIIKHRPYKSPDELVSRKVIPGKVYSGIKDKVVAR